MAGDLIVDAIIHGVFRAVSIRHAPQSGKIRNQKSEIPHGSSLPTRYRISTLGLCRTFSDPTIRCIMGDWTLAFRGRGRLTGGKSIAAQMRGQSMMTEKSESSATRSTHEPAPNDGQPAHWLDRWMQENPWHARIAPFAAYVMCMPIVDLFRHNLRWVGPVSYIAELSLVCWLLWQIGRAHV